MDGVQRRKREEISQKAEVIKKYYSAAYNEYIQRKNDVLSKQQINEKGYAYKKISFGIISLKFQEQNKAEIRFLILKRNKEKHILQKIIKADFRDCVIITKDS